MIILSGACFDQYALCLSGGGGLCDIYRAGKNRGNGMADSVGVDTCFLRIRGFSVPNAKILQYGSLL